MSQPAEVPSPQPVRRAASGGWRGARRELIIAAILVISLTAAGYAFAGPALAGVVLLVVSVLGLVTLAVLVQREIPAPVRPDDIESASWSSFARFWRAQADLATATQSLAAWQMGPRSTLQTLLAARLSERHGISLADDPGAARELLLGPDGPAGPGTRADRGELWIWIDPDRSSPDDAVYRPGIPPRALAILIDRLEQL